MKKDIKNKKRLICEDCCNELIEYFNFLSKQKEFMFNKEILKFLISKFENTKSDILNKKFILIHLFFIALLHHALPNPPRSL